jgi:hypothetical protein
MNTQKYPHINIKLISVLLISLSTLFPAQAAQIAQSNVLKLNREQVENIVRHSYQYVAMYNVNNKGAEAPESSPMGTGGWNKLSKNTSLFDASIKLIARPNNDTLYQIAMLDLRDQPMILDVPPFDSKYVSLETSAYDHYVSVPMSSIKGDYKKPEKVLFYTARTRGYKAGDKIAGIDRYLEMSGDFVMAFHRIMPHANEPEKFKRITAQINELQLMSLSEYQGKSVQATSAINFPEVGVTDTDVFANNLLEVMQFIFNHTTFDPQDEHDQALLAAYKPLGIEPGKAWDPLTAAKIDGDLFREVTGEVQQGVLALLADSANNTKFMPLIFQPKGQIALETQVVQSVLGPLGLPASEALYPSVAAADGKPMNALNDYVVKMSKDEMPPAKAFWSLTLYDNKNGFFIPNEHNKYSVGENAGFKLNADDGIEIYIAAEKPAGVPKENWLPINRGDEAIDLSLRIYAPDLEKMKTWKAPSAELVK